MVLMVSHLKGWQIRVFDGGNDIAAWMGASRFKLNSKKIKAICFFCRKLNYISNYSARVLESNIISSKSLRSASISTDRDLTMSTQITKTIQLCFTSASTNIYPGMFDKRLLKDTCIRFSGKSYCL